MVYKFILTAPVVPTFPKPSVNQELDPKSVGPVEGSPLLATSQHSFGGNPDSKSSKFGGIISQQAVENENGPAQVLESTASQNDCK